MTQPACQTFAVQAALDLWTDRGFAAMPPILFLDTLGSDILLPSTPPTAVRLLTELRERIVGRYLATSSTPPTNCSPSRTEPNSPNPPRPTIFPNSPRPSAGTWPAGTSSNSPPPGPSRPTPNRPPTPPPSAWT